MLGLTKFSFWQGDCTLGYHSIWFGHFPDPKSYFVRQLLRQLLYTMFISNNRASFHLWWRGNWVKHHKVSKYYESNYRILWTSLGTKLTFLIFLVPFALFFFTTLVLESEVHRYFVLVFIATLFYSDVGSGTILIESLKIRNNCRFIVTCLGNLL